MAVHGPSRWRTSAASRSRREVCHPKVNDQFASSTRVVRARRRCRSRPRDLRRYRRRGAARARVAGRQRIGQVDGAAVQVLARLPGPNAGSRVAPPASPSAARCRCSPASATTARGWRPARQERAASAAGRSAGRSAASTARPACGQRARASLLGVQQRRIQARSGDVGHDDGERPQQPAGLLVVVTTRTASTASTLAAAVGGVGGHRQRDCGPVGPVQPAFGHRAAA